MIGCPLRCTFCPQDKLVSSYGRNGDKYLSVENFKTILSTVPSYVRIDFSGMSEPWANPNATDMLEYALDRGFNIAIYTTLQGMVDYGRVVDLLRERKNQVEIVILHLPDELGNMRGFKPSQTYDDALFAFEYISSEFRKFEKMSMGEGWIGLTRAGNLQKIESTEATPQHSTPLYCSFTPFYDHNVVLPNGDVVLCCMDYSSKHKIGNLLQSDYFSLFGSDELNSLRVENMKYGNGDSLCRTCSRAKVLDLGWSKSNQFWEPLVVVEEFLIDE